MPIRHRGSPAKNASHLPAPQRLAQHHPARRIDRVHLEHLLGQIQTDRGNLTHGWLPFLVT